MSYADFQVGISPPWLQRTGGARVQRAFGVEGDYQRDRARQGVLAAYPGSGPNDALPYIGADRLLPQASGESNSVYAERLRTAWDSVDGWSFGGSHGSMLRALARAGFPMGHDAGAWIIQRVRRYSYLTGSTVTFGIHAGWSWDASDPSIWPQFGIVFAADVAGLSAGSESARVLNATVNLWKPVKARYMGAIVVVSLPLWGWPLTVTWGSFSWGGGSSRFIPPR